jgi:hypothetical protein
MAFLPYWMLVGLYLLLWAGMGWGESFWFASRSGRLRLLRRGEFGLGLGYTNPSLEALLGKRTRRGERRFCLRS